VQAPSECTCCTVSANTCHLQCVAAVGRLCAPLSALCVSRGRIVTHNAVYYTTHAGGGGRCARGLHGGVTSRRQQHAPCHAPSPLACLLEHRRTVLQRRAGGVLMRLHARKHLKAQSWCVLRRGGGKRTPLARRAPAGARRRRQHAPAARRTPHTNACAPVRRGLQQSRTPSALRRVRRVCASAGKVCEFRKAARAACMLVAWYTACHTPRAVAPARAA
jgi:hypothetical protein